MAEDNELLEHEPPLMRFTIPLPSAAGHTPIYDDSNIITIHKYCVHHPPVTRHYRIEASLSQTAPPVRRPLLTHGRRTHISGILIHDMSGIGGIGGRSMEVELSAEEIELHEPFDPCTRADGLKGLDIQ